MNTVLIYKSVASSALLVYTWRILLKLSTCGDGRKVMPGIARSDKYLASKQVFLCKVGGIQDIKYIPVYN
jgi:hypothetical protein